MFDSLVPDAIPRDALVTLSVIWLTALASLVLTAFLAYAFRGKVSFATLCVMGIGVAPLIIYLAIFTAVYVYGVSQIAETPIWASATFRIATIPFWQSVTTMAILAPNYLVSFVITCVVLIIAGAFKAMQEAAAVLFVILVPLHGLGLYFSYWLLTSPGSL